VARDLERTQELAKDPREAARHLSRQEENLARRTRSEMAKKDDKRALDERLKDVKDEQRSLRGAAGKLKLPEQNRRAQELKKKAEEQLAAAEKALDRKDAKEAVAKMDRAKDSLRQLADALPPMHERKQKAQQELARLQREQNEVARRAAEGKRDEAARK